MRKEKSVLLCIIGVDGVGKTTHVQRLISRLRDNGVHCKYIWFRFFHFISLPLLGYCRLTGLTTMYKTKDGRTIWNHEFFRSKIISFLYPWTLFIDMLPMYFTKIFLPLHFGYTVVSDRFIYDTFVDLMIDLNDFNIHKKLIGRFFIRLIPRNTKWILLDLNESIIRERRMDLLYDQSIEMRRKAYRQLAKELNIPIIENNATIEEVNDQIFNRFWGT